MANDWCDHVHVICPDPLKSAEFYEKIFGALFKGVMSLPIGSRLFNLPG